ncbi:MAG: alpha/beta hydrolase [Acetobacteraceae bacterium]|nr:alpha/beta hydrolase [Acetobacteraceae bacterium]
MQAEPLEVTIPPLGLGGSFASPEPGAGVVIFAHGSGSGRFSPRNRFVAAGLRQAGLGTLLLDLLRPEEAEDRRKVFDIPLLAERLRHATDWVLSEHGAGGAVPIGYFGASTGAGAALLAAAADPHRIHTVVSRGGRPDLAGPEALRRVRAPVLLIVGSLDTEVLALNRAAAAQLGGEAEIRIVQGASHLFEEPGTLEAVVALARDWFSEWIGKGRGQEPET